MNDKCPELDEDLLNAGGEEAHLHLFAWNVEFLLWLMQYQIADDRKAGSFPLPMNAYLQLTRATQHGYKFGLQNLRNEASAASQTAPAPTAANGAHDQL